MIEEQHKLFNNGYSPGEDIRKDPVAALTLFNVPGIGSAFFRILLKSLGSPAEVLRASRKTLESVPGIGSHTVTAIREARDQSVAENLLKKLEKCHATITSIWDEEYPPKLREIHDPPALLFVRGKLPEPDLTCIAVVGTRTPTVYGIRHAHQIAEELSANGIGVVSGMARGVDTAAHEGALQGNGKTYAVFGAGIDIIYPSENKILAEKIQNSGALISEFLPGVRPDPGLFPRRNRIISGLSDGVLVVQGGEKSGALITAKLALEHNRDVFALPGSVEDRRSKGPHDLIRQGANLIESAQDIFEEMGFRDKVNVKAKIKRELPLLNPSEETVIKKLSADPIHIDKLVQDLSLPVSGVLADLLNLEMKGWVRQLPGKLFTLED